MDAYDCKRFIHGCPDADYYSDEIYKCKGLNSIISNSLTNYMTKNKLIHAMSKVRNSIDFLNFVLQ